MNFQQYSEEFRRKASAAAFSEEEVLKCLTYAKPLIDQKLPVIYNTTHLSALVGYRKVYLKKAALYTSYFYRKFTISKRNGKPRTIAEPLPSLKEIQLWILKNILENVPVSKFAKAYLPDRDIKDNVKYHIGKPVILKLDIQNFFNSISQTDVQDIFLEMKYSFFLSNLMSKLCTLNLCLPQGASTSPYLSNLYMRTFDKRIGEMAVKEKLRYTRYADDMTFSGDFAPETVLRLVETELSKFNLTLNQKKIVIMRPNQRQLVTGIVINEKMQVPRQDRQNVRLQMYFIRKFGLDNHVAKVKINKDNYLQHLLGKINFIINVNPEDNEFIEYKSFLIKRYINKELL